MINGKNPPCARRSVTTRHTNHIDKNVIGVSSDNCTPIYIHGKHVGDIHGDVFVKQVRWSKHFYRKKRCWCFDYSTLRDAKIYGARWVELNDIELGQKYRAAISTIYAFGINVDEKHGKQIGLPLEYWSKGSEPCGEQLRLWSEP